MAVYPGFSTVRADDILSLRARVGAMAAFEAAVAAAQASAGDIPAEAAAAIASAAESAVDPEILADGWQRGTPVLGLLDALKSRLPDGAKPHLHHRLTTQDVVDSAAMILVRAAIGHLADLT